MTLTVQEMASSLLRVPSGIGEAAYNAFKIAQLLSRTRIVPGGCWLYQGKIHASGYTVASYRDKSYNTSRVMWLALRGPIEGRLDVCHTCDVRNCINPDHLWLGTRKQNLLDMADKKRGNKASVTHCPRGHEYAGDNLRKHKGSRRRGCKLCDRIRQRIAMGWTEDEAINTPPIPQGAKTPRRVIGVRNRGAQL